jgi:Flp pilus assembly protein TadG
MAIKATTYHTRIRTVTGREPLPLTEPFSASRPAHLASPAAAPEDASVTSKPSRNRPSVDPPDSAGAVVPPPRLRRRSRGQSLVEFTLVVPLLMLVIGGIIQFGLILWAQNTLTQVVRDTGRWAATQQDCTLATEGPLIIAKANSIAGQSTLFGYVPASWTSANVTVSWQTNPATDPCPPTNNQQTSFVTISVTHQVPLFFPLVPGGGTLTTSTQFRMEPAP